MLSDVKAGFQIVIFLIALAIAGFFIKDAIPTITQTATLPERINAENADLRAKSQLVQAQAAAQLTAVPTYEMLKVVATIQAINNEKVLVQSRADATVVQANGQASLQNQIGQSILSLVFGVIALGGAFLGLRFLGGLILIHQSSKQGGSIAMLPNGEVRYAPIASSRHVARLEPEHTNNQIRAQSRVAKIEIE